METASRTCRFILICNYQSGIIEPIQSRCSIFRFKQLDETEASDYLARICKAEKIQADPKALTRIVELSEGDLRRAVNLLQVAATSSKGGRLELSRLKEFLPETQSELVGSMLKLALKGDFIKARDMMYELMGKYGVSGREIIRTAIREIGRIPEFSDSQLQLVRALGEYDFRLTQGANEDIQLSAMLAQIAEMGRK
jgi:replication factor C small subunit